MIKLKLSKETPGLLVSVRSAAEALAALAGGADVIDVKEPNQGSLGAADDDTISAVVRAVAGRAPVSAALGELVDLIGSPNGDYARVLIDGVLLFKTGLARCHPCHLELFVKVEKDWRERAHLLDEMGIKQ